jgi:hypothetical protein
MKKNTNFLIVVLSVVLLLSCKDNQGYSKINSAPEVSENAVHKIIVNDFINAAGYTYLDVTEGNENYWMAIAEMPIEKGGTYYYTDGMQMKNFTSKELNKTFDVIVFSEGINASEQNLVKPNVHNHAPAESVKNTSNSESDINISKAKGGVTVGELYGNPAAYSNKEVIVRGKVVKVNNGILDKNWVHIVDGTNFEGKKDLTITTTNSIKVGDTVTFKAKVTLDKDFGGGYIYALLLEDGEEIQ